MNIFKKNILIILSICYILANIVFYNTFYRDYVNVVIFFVTSFLFIFESVFWFSFFSILNNLKNEKKSEKIIVESVFLTAVAGIGIQRILLNSSLYINDLLNSDTFLILIFGSIRLLFIFSVILFFIYIKDIKNIFLNIVACINILIAVLVWLDFDTGIASICRIIIGLLVIIFIVMLKKTNNSQEEEIHEKI